MTLAPAGAHLPLSPAVFHILLALAEGPRHGYAVMRDIDSRTDGVVRIGPGMLYGSIKWLLADGFIEETDAPRGEAAKDAERRRYYALTTDGRKLLRAEANRLESALDLARARWILPSRAAR